MTKQLFENGHLNDAGILLYVEGLLLQKTAELPEAVLDHVENCAECRAAVFEYYEFVKDEPRPSESPYFKKHTHSNRALVPRWYWAAAAITIVLVSTITFLFNRNHRQGTHETPLITNNDTLVLTPNTKIIQDSTSKEIPLPKQEIKTKPQKPLITQTKPGVHQPNNQLAYTTESVIPSLDRIIARKGTTRGFQVYQPALMAQLNGKATFTWSPHTNDTLTLAIFTKKNQSNPQTWPLFPMDSTYRVPVQLDPGLYYWTITQPLGRKNKRLALGKFVMTQ